MESVTRKENHIITADILDDLASRFIINVPDDERSNFIRICFQIELAHWFYLDFYCTGEESKSLAPCGIKQFACHIFKHIPFLSIHVKKLDEILLEWKQYKMTVPTYGAILMTSDLKHVLLVQSYWAKSSWGFPKGKVNEDEDPLHCAIREVYEETGFDISKLAVEDEFIEGVLNYQYTRLYLIRNVPLETIFIPRTRKEIKYCEWFCIDHLPIHKTDPVSKAQLGINANSFFMIMPFVKRLKKWINERQNDNNLSAKKCKPTNKSTTNCANSIQGSSGGGSAGSSGGGSNSPKTVFFKNNSSHRQRHKSLGDIEAQIANNPYALINDPKHKLSSMSNQSSAHNTPTTLKLVQHNGKQPVQYNSANNNNQDKRFELMRSDDGGNQQNVNKRKLFSTNNTTLDTLKIKPITQIKILSRDHHPQQQQQQQQQIQKQHKLYLDGDDNVAASTSQCNTKITKKLSKTLHSMNRSAIFNTPHIAQLLQDEPNIKKWLNIQLNKDVIFAESLKVLV